MESAGSGDQALAVKPWVGQIQQPTNAPAFDNQPPSVNLDLEYIYGYRCFDTRQNVFYTNAANKIVYMAAAVGITLNTSTNV
jgi:microtubule-associated protein-like 6